MAFFRDRAKASQAARSMSLHFSSAQPSGRGRFPPSFDYHPSLAGKVGGALILDISSHPSLAWFRLPGWSSLDVSLAAWFVSFLWLLFFSLLLFRSL